MATVIKAEDFPIEFEESPEGLNVEAFKGFSPDDDFDDVVRKCGEAAQAYKDSHLGKTALSTDDFEMIRLNAQSVPLHVNEWARATGFDTDIRLIDPSSNIAIFGNHLLKLVD